jgi:hypothetical protein
MTDKNVGRISIYNFLGLCKHETISYPKRRKVAVTENEKH